MNTYISNTAKISGFDPSLIAAIIASIMDFISSCKKAPSSEEVISGGGLYGRLLIARALRANGIHPLGAGGLKITNALIDEAKGASHEEAEQFIIMAQS